MNTIIQQQSHYPGNFSFLTPLHAEFHLNEVIGYSDQNIGPLLHFSAKATNGTVSVKAKGRNTLFLIPLKGNIKCCFSHIEDIVIRHENMGILLSEKDAEFHIGGTHSSEEVKYIQISMKCDAAVFLAPSMFPLKISSLLYNKLTNIFSYGSLSILYSFRKISAGKFNAGRSLLYRPMDKYISKCLLYAVEGNFQIDGQPLSCGNVLSLWNTENFVVAALSEDAVILIFEYNGVPNSKLVAS